MKGEKYLFVVSVPSGTGKDTVVAALLKKHHGNRQQVAAELGVSKTTLWRYLKKYGIDPDYHC